LSPGAKHFVLKVSGNSMIEDGILDGDFVVIREQDTASNGQTVVALVGNEATIKRFYQRRDRIELHPANAAYEPLVLSNLNDSALDFQIEGILVGLIRRVPS
jgi:repressor LexA